MYSDWVSPAIAGLLVIWLGILSFLIWKQNKFLKSLFPKSGERDIRRKFEEVLSEIKKYGIDLETLEKQVRDLQSHGLIPIQRVELERFNPYDDTGGDQSFTIALLNDKGDGVVITSLHARSGTRIFAKDVKAGESSKYKFSEEEEKVIKKALQS